MRILSAMLAVLIGFSQTAFAFCGFYVTTGNDPVLNRASRVVLAREDNRTMVTMASDFRGDPRQFAIVIPVPQVVRREQVRVVNSATVNHLLEYTRPRIVEYHDADPCAPPPPSMAPFAAGRSRGMQAQPVPSSPPPPTVRVEAEYSVGEYDIVVLSATDGADLIRYLNRSGYRMPAGAEPVVRSYLQQRMFFFLAKVNLARAPQTTNGFLRPIQVEYASPRFMLPIRLGVVNADGPQEMVVLGLTRRGRIETSNYRTVRMPTDQNVPVYVRERFGEFYDAVFARQQATQGSAPVFLEYAWDLGTCDPCSAPPLSNAELRELGASWIPPGGFGPGPTFVTRLHVRYDAARFPEDLMLQETPDRSNFQVRFVTRNPFMGQASCAAGEAYRATLPARFTAEAHNLAKLTGWAREEIDARMRAMGQTPG
jgi:hypothetical protein